MRLTTEQIDNLKESVLNIDKSAKIILFGSRVDDNRKGGDIDILILSTKIKKEDIWSIRDKFYEKFGEQKLDILVDNGQLEDPFKRRAFNEGVYL